MFVDYYQLLEVAHDASPDVIKKAYRAHLHKWHPDKNPGAAAAERTCQIIEAFLILSDPDAKRMYDVTYREHYNTHFARSTSNQQNATEPAGAAFQFDRDLLQKWVDNAKKQAADLAKHTLEELSGSMKEGLSTFSRTLAFRVIGGIIILGAISLLAAGLQGTSGSQSESSVNYTFLALLLWLLAATVVPCILFPEKIRQFVRRIDLTGNSTKDITLSTGIGLGAVGFLIVVIYLVVLSFPGRTRPVSTETLPSEALYQANLLTADTSNPNRYSDAYPFLLQAAQNNEAGALSQLGEMFNKGLGVQKDQQKAWHWYTQGAKAGDSNCMEWAGVISEELGHPSEALSYFRQAAQQGSPGAIYLLGQTYLTNDKVRNYDSAVVYINKAIQGGYRQAYYLQGLMFEDGYLYQQDPKRAFQLYKEALDPRSGWLYTNVGRCFADGIGCEKNLDSAAFYYTKGYELGDIGGKQQLLLLSLEKMKNASTKPVSQVKSKKKFSTAKAKKQKRADDPENDPEIQAFLKQAGYI